MTVWNVDYQKDRCTQLLMHTTTSPLDAFASNNKFQVSFSFCRDPVVTSPIPLPRNTCIIARNHYSQIASHEGAISRCKPNLSWAIMGHRGWFLTTDYNVWLPECTYTCSFLFSLIVCSFYAILLYFTYSLPLALFK